MKELLYFSFADLMVRVDYNKDANSLRYSSHRKISFGERVIVEQYLLTNIALKTDYYKKQPALFIYLGVNAQLGKELKLFHLKNTLKTLVDKEKDVKVSVDNLINQSMLNFYFEKIGDTILTIRQEVENKVIDDDLLLEHKQRLEELVDAYNLYSNEKINVQKVLPTELQKFLGFELK
jgi:UTP-glucose-1-phosphate uridylyltransferase